LFPSKIEAAQPKPKGLRPEQIILIAWGVVAAVMVLLLLRVLRRRS